MYASNKRVENMQIRQAISIQTELQIDLKEKFQTVTFNCHGGDMGCSVRTRRFSLHPRQIGLDLRVKMLTFINFLILRS